LLAVKSVLKISLSFFPPGREKGRREFFFRKEEGKRASLSCSESPREALWSLTVN